MMNAPVSPSTNPKEVFKSLNQPYTTAMKFKDWPRFNSITNNLLLYVVVVAVVD